MPIGPGGPWHTSAPRGVRKAYQAADDPRGWQAWCRHLAERKHQHLAKLLGADDSPLLWHASTVQGTRELIGSLADVVNRSSRRSLDYETLVADWLGAAATADGSPDFGLECLAWCDALPALAPHLSERSWWLLLNSLVTIAGHGDPAIENPLASLLVAAELPLSLAHAFPELAACRCLAEAGSRAAIEALGELTDEQGVIHASHLPLLRPLVACWTRSIALGDANRATWLTGQVRQQYARVLRCALQLTRADGSQVLAAPGSEAWNLELAKAALRLADDALARRAWRLTTVGQLKRNARRVKDLPPAIQSEPSTLALLRTDWTRSSPRALVSYSGRQMQFELASGKELMLSGTWDVDVRVGGVALRPRADWEQACWETDEDVDYLELELRLDSQVRIERHILLGRKDPFLFMADTILGASDGPIDYHMRLPLAGAKFRAQRETHDGMLWANGRPRARVLPLGLPEWRSSPRRGELSAAAESLELAQSSRGRTLFAPLFIDLDPRRLGKEATWRQLTIAEDRELVRPDVAAGYRVQCGNDQWVVYRSLVRGGIRTLLSVSVAHEFLVAEFHTDGSTRRLLEIEPE